MDPLEIVGNKKGPFIKKTVENRTDKYETSLNNAKDALRLWNDTALECADPVPASEGKGYVKATRFKNSRKKAAYSYMLTPQGIEEKSLMLVQFLRRKKSEYQLLEQEIARLTQELDAHDTTEPTDRS